MFEWSTHSCLVQEWAPARREGRQRDVPKFVEDLGEECRIEPQDRPRRSLSVLGNSASPEIDVKLERVTLPVSTSENHCLIPYIFINYTVVAQLFDVNDE